VGAAYAARVLGEDTVAMCWFGEGATSEGVTHEAMNLAGVHRLPVVFVCENNGLAISVPQALQMPVASVADRAAAYGMCGVSVDGCDAWAVHQATHDAVARARNGEGPSLIEAVVPRITPHSSQDDDAYRSDAERAEAESRDPLPRLRSLLLERGVLSSADDETLRDAVDAEVIADEDLAAAQPSPDAGRARWWLYAGDPPHVAPEPEERHLAWTGVHE
jgi:2-oxoisovalerate dehydrogenase E1 component alpha subunit